MQNKVFVSSYSAVSSLGCNLTETKTALQSGKRKFIKDITCDFQYPHFAVNKFANNKTLIKASNLCLQALNNIQDSIKGLQNVPVFLASSTGGIVETELNFTNLDGYPLMNSHFYNTVINDIHNAYPNLNTAMTFSTACSSSGHGFYQAFRYMKKGIIDKALIIGYDVLSWTTNVGFDSLKIVSHNGIKPFTVDRDGLSLGDGAGVMLLECNPTAEPVAELLAAESNSDGYHISSPDPSGESQHQCMLNALNFAEINPNEIDYICGHGTGTTMNDEVELNVIKSIFADNTELQVNSLKSFIGHTMGASAVVELAISLLGVKEGKIYQPSGLGQVMDERLIPTETITKKVKYFFKNAFGFGGNNVSLLLKMV